MHDKQAELFKILGVESRIRIIELLKQRGPLGVIELSDELGITPSAVSQHLKIMKSAGLVRSERKGYWIPYDVDPETLEECGGLLSQVCNCGCGCCDPSANDIDSLKEQERRLEKELEDVRARLRTLDQKS